MSDLTLVPMDEPGLQLYRSWFEDDMLRRRIEYPTDTWYEYVRREPGVYAWMVYEDDVPVGSLQLDTQADGTGYPGLVVKPALRNRGYGKRILRALLDRPEAQSLTRIVGTAEVDNVAAQRCLAAAGLAQQGTVPDSDGFLTFVYERT